MDLQLKPLTKSEAKASWDRIEDGLERMESSMIDTRQELLRFDTGSGWAQFDRADGHKYRSMADFLKDQEQVSRRHAYRLLETARVNCDARVTLGYEDLELTQRAALPFTAVKDETARKAVIQKAWHLAEAETEEGEEIILTERHAKAAVRAAKGPGETIEYEPCPYCAGKGRLRKGSAGLWGNAKYGVQFDPAGKCFVGVTEPLLIDLGTTYPNCDIRDELRKAATWVAANPEKGKKTNYQRFLVGWLARHDEKIEDANRPMKPSEAWSKT